MILIEVNQNIFNITNSNVIVIKDNKIYIYYNNDNVVTINDASELDISNFPEYFLKFSDGNTVTYLNKYHFLYFEKIEENLIRFYFFENFSYEIETNFDTLIENIS